MGRKRKQSTQQTTSEDPTAREAATLPPMDESTARTTATEILGLGAEFDETVNLWFQGHGPVMPGPDVIAETVKRIYQHLERICADLNARGIKPFEVPVEMREAEPNATA